MLYEIFRFNLIFLLFSYAYAQIEDPKTAYMPQNLGPTKLKDKNPLFNVNTQWEINDRHCMDVLTPPPNSVLVPYYDVWIRWNKTEECNPIIPLTNFDITLYNDLKSSGNLQNPRVKSAWDKPIARGVQEFQYKWKVPLIPDDEVKNISLYYIRVSTQTNINSGMYTVFGVTGPLTIWTTPDKENKTLFSPPEIKDIRTNKTEKIGKFASECNNFISELRLGILFNLVISWSLIAASVAFFFL
ncbi:hypothetical protein G9A89_000946 [Geosiphon pyriformis]|nr:hypothetical protein G9A89_000946 [Geosiphon pyriformis]